VTQVIVDWARHATTFGCLPKQCPERCTGQTGRAVVQPDAPHSPWCVEWRVARVHRPAIHTPSCTSAAGQPSKVASLDQFSSYAYHRLTPPNPTPAPPVAISSPRMTVSAPVCCSPEAVPVAGFGLTCTPAPCRWSAANSDSGQCRGTRLWARAVGELLLWNEQTYRYLTVLEKQALARRGVVQKLLMPCKK
jgi:hypothetical protein